MSYSEVILKGAAGGQATVTSGKLDVNANLTGGSINIEMTAEIVGASIIASIPAGVSLANLTATGTSSFKIGVTNAAYLVVDALPTRRFIRLENQGGTLAWFHGSSDVSFGASANNFASLAISSAITLENYGGAIYGRAGGASLAPVYVGVLQAS